MAYDYKREVAEDNWHPVEPMGLSNDVFIRIAHRPRQLALVELPLQMGLLFGAIHHVEQ